MRGFRKKDVIDLFTTGERNVSSAPKIFFPKSTNCPEKVASDRDEKWKKDSGLSPYVS